MPLNRCRCVYWLFHFQCFTISNVRIARQTCEHLESWSSYGRQVPATRWYQVMLRQFLAHHRCPDIQMLLVPCCNSFLWSHPKEIETQMFSHLLLRVADRLLFCWCFFGCAPFFVVTFGRVSVGMWHYPVYFKLTHLLWEIISPNFQNEVTNNEKSQSTTG